MSENQMTTNNETVTSETDADPMYQLYMEIQSEISRLKKRPPRDFGHFMVLFTGTFLGYMRDMAYRLSEDSAAIEELYEQTGDEDDGETRITKEDADKLNLVLNFAREVASGMLAQSSAEEQDKFKAILQHTEECLKLVAESTIQEDDEEDESEEEEEEEEEVPAEEKPS